MDAQFSDFLGSLRSRFSVLIDGNSSGEGAAVAFASVAAALSAGDAAVIISIIQTPAHCRAVLKRMGVSSDTMADRLAVVYPAVESGAASLKSTSAPSSATPIPGSTSSAPTTSAVGAIGAVSGVVGSGCRVFGEGLLSSSTACIPPPAFLTCIREAIAAVATTRVSPTPAEPVVTTTSSRSSAPTAGDSGGGVAAPLPVASASGGVKGAAHSPAIPPLHLAATAPPLLPPNSSTNTLPLTGRSAATVTTAPMTAGSPSATGSSSSGSSAAAATAPVRVHVVCLDTSSIFHACPPPTAIRMLRSIVALATHADLNTSGLVMAAAVNASGEAPPAPTTARRGSVSTTVSSPALVAPVSGSLAPISARRGSRSSPYPEATGLIGGGGGIHTASARSSPIPTMSGSHTASARSSPVPAMPPPVPGSSGTSTTATSTSGMAGLHAPSPLVARRSSTSAPHTPEVVKPLPRRGSNTSLMGSSGIGSSGIAGGTSIPVEPAASRPQTPLPPHAHTQPRSGSGSGSSVAVKEVSQSIRVDVLMRFMSDIDYAVAAPLASHRISPISAPLVAGTGSGATSRPSYTAPGSSRDGALFIGIRSDSVSSAFAPSAFVSGFGSGTGQPDLAEFTPVSALRYICTLADTIARVAPLPSGYSKDVSGRLSIQRKPTYLVGSLGITTSSTATTGTGGASGTSVAGRSGVESSALPAASTRVDGGAVLLPNVAIPTHLTAGSSTSAVLSWVRERPHTTLFRVAPDSTLKCVGSVTVIKT